MDILKAEILKKKRLLEENKLIDEKRKYFKRGDLVAKEEQEYREKYGNTISVTSLKDTKTSKDGNQTEDNNEQTVLARAEVIRRLRDRCEPILLFGETELEAFRRLRKCEILEPEMNKGFRNDFQEAMEKVDQAFLDELLESSARESHSNVDDDGNSSKSISEQSTKDRDDKEDSDLTYDGILEMAKSMGRGNRNLDMKVIMMFLQFLLRMWGDKLNNRPASEKSSTRGKMAGATYTQTQVYLKPLLRKLKTTSLPEDISDSLTDIVRHLLDRNYLQASDAYLQMAIGNAPWPIGVTMVGIHARTGREKIFSKNVAHVMNDETQRKYIQALKRLMTKCQEYFPTDPSRCVEYAAFDNKQQNI